MRDLAPVPLPVKYGTPNLGGPMITGGGLVFIGAAMDNYIRAINIDTGTELWKRRLPAGGQATPMTYRLAPDQPQMVVIAAGGHGWMGSKLGDYVIAFSLRSPITSVVLWLLETLLALALVLNLRRFLFPPAVSNRVGKNWFPRWTQRATNLVCGVTALAALGLVLPGMMPLHHWLIPFSSLVLLVILTCVVFKNLVTRRPGTLAVAGGLLLLTSVVAYWEMGELFWVGVLPW